MPQPGRILTAREAAERIGCTPQTVRRFAAEGLLRSVVLPSPSRKRNQRRFHSEDVDRFIKTITNDEVAS